MKHSSIRELFGYWNERRGLRSAPERGDIEPGAIRRILADTFMLAVDGRAGHPFRIAGTRVCAAFGRELKGEAFVDLWAAENQDLIRDILAIVAQETIGVVLSARGQRVADKGAAGGSLDLELIILPLNHRGRTTARVVGALAPVETPCRTCRTPGAAVVRRVRHSVAAPPPLLGCGVRCGRRSCGSGVRQKEVAPGRVAGSDSGGAMLKTYKGQTYEFVGGRRHIRHDGGATWLDVWRIASGRLR